MTALAILLRALLARYGAELVAQTLQWVISRPADERVPHERERQAVVELEAKLVGGYGELVRRDPAFLDVTSMDFEDTGYIWDTPTMREDC